MFIFHFHHNVYISLSPSGPEFIYEINISSKDIRKTIKDFNIPFENINFSKILELKSRYEQGIREINDLMADIPLEFV